MAREMVLLPRIYYIRKDGSNFNTGFADSPTGALRTWEYAIETVCALDTNCKQIILKHGTETAPQTFSTPLTIPTITGGGSLVFEGLPTAGHTIFDTPGQDPFLFSGTGITTYLRDMTIRGGFSGKVHTQYHGRVVIGNGVIFGPGNTTDVFVHDNQALAMMLSSSYTTLGGGPHVFVNAGMAFLEGASVTVGGAAFPGGFLSVHNAGRVQILNTTFLGSSSPDIKFWANANGVINTFGKPLSYIPGTLPGILTNGGIYV